VADSETSNAKIRNLQEERVTTLRQAVKLALIQYTDGASDIKPVFALQLDLLDAELDLAETRADQIKVLASQLKIAKGSLAAAEQKFQGGMAGNLDVLEAKSVSLRIEIRLLKVRLADQEQCPK
jgi:outer membrane protein TolC